MFCRVKSKVKFYFSKSNISRHQNRENQLWKLLIPLCVQNYNFTATDFLHMRQANLNIFLLLFALMQKVAKKSRKYEAIRFLVVALAIRGNAIFSKF